MAGWHWLPASASKRPCHPPQSRIDRAYCDHLRPCNEVVVANGGVFHGIPAASRRPKWPRQNKLMIFWWGWHVPDRGEGRVFLAPRPSLRSGRATQDGQLILTRLLTICRRVLAEHGSLVGLAEAELAIERNCGRVASHGLHFHQHDPLAGTTLKGFAQQIGGQALAAARGVDLQIDQSGRARRMCRPRPVPCCGRLRGPAPARRPAASLRTASDQNPTSYRRPTNSATADPRSSGSSSAAARPIAPGPWVLENRSSRGGR